MSAWVKIGLPLTVLGAIGLGAGLVSTSVVTACSSSSNGGSSSGGSSSSGSCPSTSNPLTPGTFPPPTCLVSDESTCGTPTTCPIAEACGSTAPTSCMPLANNTGAATDDFRIRRLNVIAPPTLANPIIAGSVVTTGVNLNLKECGETGMGTFTWLLRVNTTANTLETGGAPLAFDPLGAGYCFANTILNPGPSQIDIAPVTVPLTKNADGSYNSGTIASLNIPIYVVSFGDDGGIVGTPQTIVLPINGGQIQGMTISDDGNCIGSIDTTALGSNCAEPDDSTCTEWKTAGSLGGYITLAQADKVEVPQLGTTLCAVLTQQSVKGTCTKNAAGAYVAQGDYCSTSTPPGPATSSCADSFWLAATFAASAIKINDGSTTPECQGTSSGGEDAGPDTGGSAQDAGDAAPE